LFLFLTASAHATLVELDWYPDPAHIYPSGNNYLTRDTDTGLEWLDTDLTLGMTREEVEAQLGVGGSFYGFSLASISQFQTLLDSFGLDTPLTAEPSEINQQYALSLLQMVDMIGGGQSLFVGDGLLYWGASLADGSVFSAYSERECLAYPPGECLYPLSGQVDVSSNLGNFLGSYLVRSVVPEPGTFILACIGIISLFLMSRLKTLLRHKPVCGHRSRELLSHSLQ
jgi:hypothetical protein